MEIFYTFFSKTSPQKTRMFIVFYRTGETSQGDMRVFEVEALEGEPLNIKKNIIVIDYVARLHFERGTKQGFIMSLLGVSRWK